MTDGGSEPPEIVSDPDPGPAERPEGWVAGPPPPPPGRDPGIPVVDASPSGSRPRPPGGRPAAGELRDRLHARLRREPAWNLAAAAILVAYACAWLASLLRALRHEPGLSAQQRLLDLFGPGSVQWGVLMLVALGFMAAARRPAGGTDGDLGRVLPAVVLIASATVAAAAAFGVVVELANFANGIDAAFSGIVARLGALATSGAALWWAWRPGDGGDP